MKPSYGRQDQPNHADGQDKVQAHERQPELEPGAGHDRDDLDSDAVPDEEYDHRKGRERCDGGVRSDGMRLATCSAR